MPIERRKDLFLCVRREQRLGTAWEFSAASGRKPIPDCIQRHDRPQGAVPGIQGSGPEMDPPLCQRDGARVSIGPPTEMATTLLVVINNQITFWGCKENTADMDRDKECQQCRPWGLKVSGLVLESSSSGFESWFCRVFFQDSPHLPRLRFPFHEVQ